MADIFISYSQLDRDQARLLAAFLEAEGYSVWWDTSLLSGEKFRKVIMTELGQARATIVIWTGNSVESDWVHSEAGRAHADHKLIPVKAKGLTYREIPPPFDNMHIENVEDREKILAAVVAQLAKPEVRASRLGKATKRARFELLSWFGVFGAVITLTTNLRSVVTLANWVRQFIESWTTILTYTWGHIFFFIPKIFPGDAIILTLVAFAILNTIICLRRNPTSDFNGRRLALILGASFLISIVFGTGLMRFTFEESGYYSQTFIPSFSSRLLDLVIDRVDINASTTLAPILFKALVLMIFGYLVITVLFTLPPLIPALLTYLLITRLTSFRLSASALALRLWRIVAGIVLLLAANYASIWIEEAQWLSELAK